MLINICILVLMATGVLTIQVELQCDNHTTRDQICVAKMGETIAVTCISDYNAVTINTCCTDNHIETLDSQLSTTPNGHFVRVANITVQNKSTIVTCSSNHHKMQFDSIEILVEQPPAKLEKCFDAHKRQITCTAWMVDGKIRKHSLSLVKEGLYPRFDFRRTCYTGKHQAGCLTLDNLSQISVIIPAEASPMDYKCTVAFSDTGATYTTGPLNHSDCMNVPSEFVQPSNACETYTSYAIFKTAVDGLLLILTGTNIYLLYKVWGDIIWQFHRYKMTNWTIEQSKIIKTTTTDGGVGVKSDSEQVIDRRINKLGYINVPPTPASRV